MSPNGPSDAPECGSAGVGYAALTRLGIIVLAAADLEELHQAAHPTGCRGCRICRATIPLLHRVVATTRTEADPGSPRSREEQHDPTAPPPEGVRP